MTKLRVAVVGAALAAGSLAFPAVASAAAQSTPNCSQLLQAWEQARLQYQHDAHAGSAIRAADEAAIDAAYVNYEEHC